MGFKLQHLSLLTLGIAVGVAISVGGSVFAEKAATPLDPHPLPLEDLRAFSEIFNKIKEDYVEPVDDKVILENAIRGMLSGLDPHSAYLNVDEFSDLQVGTSGEFGGLGIEVTMEDGFVKVVSPIDDTPAMRAGVVAGDLIIRLDETPVKGMTLTAAVAIMRGKVGEPLKLTIIRKGESLPLTITVVRDVIKTKSVKKEMLEPGFAYLRITSFQNRTKEQVYEAVAALKEEHGNEKLKGMVLDLRNNPGGVLGAAVGVSDAFINKGLIVYTQGRAEDSELKFNAKPDDILDGAPLVVLINGGSASASEIVAGALQDQKRALIMGSKSFGKGSVQTIFPMSSNTAVKFTTARYYTPSGRSIQAEGIVPDIAVEPLKLKLSQQSGFQRITEANLTGHLQGESERQQKDEQGNGTTVAPKADEEADPLENELPDGTATEDGKEKKPTLAEKDYVLNEALTLLKGLNILSGREIY
ncbi:MAG: S41 family peptidase [Gammaproteobacteria bacterium]|nr:S41 family peptidase [Gammaproteobacteria bacterium]